MEKIEINCKYDIVTVFENNYEIKKKSRYPLGIAVIEVINSLYFRISILFLLSTLFIFNIIWENPHILSSAMIAGFMFSVIMQVWERQKKIIIPRNMIQSFYKRGNKLFVRYQYGKVYKTRDIILYQKENVNDVLKNVIEYKEEPLDDSDKFYIIKLFYYWGIIGCIISIILFIVLLNMHMSIYITLLNSILFIFCFISAVIGYNKQHRKTEKS